MILDIDAGRESVDHYSLSYTDTITERATQMPSLLPNYLCLFIMAPKILIKWNKKITVYPKISGEGWTFCSLTVKPLWLSLRWISIINRNFEDEKGGKTLISEVLILTYLTWSVRKFFSVDWTINFPFTDKKKIKKRN